MRTKVFWVLMFLSVFSIRAQQIKVACIGDSVTYGSGIEDKEQHSYPSQLQVLLGGDYRVENFGHPGATLLRNGHKPYWNQSVFEQSKDFLPDVVVIHLGLNDQGLNNWPDHKSEFIEDYKELIETYRSLDSQPEVWICKMTPSLSGHHWFTEGMREYYQEIQTQIQQVSKEAKVRLIDLNKSLVSFPEYYADDLHPNKQGASLIAKQVYSSLSGDYGGLKLSKLYAEDMVLQRGTPIEITGVANAGDTIEVQLGQQRQTTVVDYSGTWRLLFSEMKAGGPYKMVVSSSLKPKTIRIDRVFVGEVWLASGQSNMDFKLAQMQSAQSFLKDSINPEVYVFSMDPNLLKSGVYTEDDKQYLHADTYMNYGKWTNTASQELKEFSAIAYVFADQLQKKLKVPVGVVCNAVGGAPIESWISRKTLESSYQTVELLNDTWRNPRTDSWVRERKAENFNENKRLKLRHPYDPSFLFDSGINPLSGYQFKGVIWYQGESNTEHPELYSQLFNLLVKDWRSHFKNPNLPFYYVQLSDIERPNFGRFRDLQRKLLSIPYTGMAVSHDLGAQSDIHPKQKWPIGERLAKIALNKTYKEAVACSGPTYDYTTYRKNKLVVHFKHAEGLTTTDGMSVKDLQIAGADQRFVPARSKIKNKTLILWSSEIDQPRYIRYGYNSFTDANLINAFGLPASTFSNLPPCP